MANLCKPIHNIINYFTFICPFESGKCGSFKIPKIVQKSTKIVQKFKYLQNEKSFLNEIKTIFYSF